MLTSGIFKKLLRTTKTFLIKNGTSKSPSYSQNAKECEIISSQLKESFKNIEDNGLIIPFFKKALLYYDKHAIQDYLGEYSYLQLYTKAKSLSIQVSNICGSASSSNVIYICPNNILTIISQWSCWMSGQVAIPFPSEYLGKRLENLAVDLQPKLLITTPISEKSIKIISERLDIAYIIIDHTFMRTEDVSLSKFKKLILVSNGSFILEGIPNNDFYTNSLALLLKHSHGYNVSTGYSKITHKFINNELKRVFDNFEFKSFDVLYQFVPVNSIYEMCCLASGQKVVLVNVYNIQYAWSTIFNAFDISKVQVFASLPKIYEFILIEFKRNFSNHNFNTFLKSYLKKQFRFVVYCNNTSSVTNISNRWKEITGTNLYSICYSDINKVQQKTMSDPDIIAI